MRRAIVVAVLLIFTSGCASNHGTQTVNDFNRFMKLENAVTRKNGVFDLFGQPHEVRKVQETGGTIWTYYAITGKVNAATYIPYINLVAGGNDFETTRADFFFDAGGVLINSNREQSARYKNMWLGLGDGLTASGEVEKVEAEMEALGLPFDRELAKDYATAADVYAN
jgi:hypothetical protein